MAIKVKNIDPEVLLNHGQHEALREVLAGHTIDTFEASLLIESYILTYDYNKVNKLLEEWEKQLELECPGKLFYFKSVLLEKEKDHENIQIILRDKLNLTNTTNDINQAWLLLALSRSLYFYAINLAEGGTYAQIAIDTFSKHEMGRSESYAWQLLGAHLIKLKDYSGAEEAFLRTLDLRRILNNPQLVGQTATSLASVALKLNRFLSARNYFFTALEEGFRLRPETVYKLCQTWYNIGIVSYKMAELEEAREAFQLAMINARKNQYLFLPDTLYYLGRIESLLNQPHQSKFYYKQALLIYEGWKASLNDASTQILQTLFFYMQQLVLINNKKEFFDTYLNYMPYFESNEGKLYKKFIDIFSKEFEIKISLPPEFYKQILLECKKNDEKKINILIEFSLNKLFQSLFKQYIQSYDTNDYVLLCKILTEQYQNAIEQNDISIQIQTLFCRAILEKIQNKDDKIINEDLENALKLTNDSELPWHYGFITKYSNWIIKSNNINTETRKVLEKLLEDCIDNFLVVINTFIGSIK